MRWPAAILALALCASPAAGQDDSWGLRLLNETGSAQQDCDLRCQQDRLICVEFSHAGSKAFRVEDLTDQYILPWGAVDFAMAASMMSDRKDIDPDDLSGGERRTGPEVVNFADHDWVEAEYGFASGAETFAITLLLWPDKSVTRGLRCSYQADADPIDQIRDWAGGMRR